MTRLPQSLAALLLPTALLLSAPLWAQTVYQWKDANGVTQYSSTPPAEGSYETRRMNVPPGTPAEAEVPEEDATCALVRKDLELLRGDRTLKVDSDGDGEPDRTLDDAERANRIQLAEATLRVKCGGGAAPPPESTGAGVAK